MVPNSKIDISIIIPAKDEEKRLPHFLLDLISFCQTSNYSYEIIVVDDGSIDETSRIVCQFQPKFGQLHLIQLKQNRGKGFAVKTGVLSAVGEYILFMDADGSTGPDAIEENIKHLKNGHDIVIGSRVVKDQSHKVQAKQYRKTIGQVFNAMVHLFLIQSIQDTQCGFKMFKSNVVKELFTRLNIHGFGFDLEILYLAKLFNFKIIEVPVNWKHVDDSKTNLYIDSIKMLWNIFQIKCWHLKKVSSFEPFMSDKEIASMNSVQKEHWWFQSKLYLLKSLLKGFNNKDRVILDAGCGAGLNLSVLKSFGECYGCDAVQSALVFSQKNGNHNLIRCDLETMSLKNNQFDCVTLLDVLEHVPYPEKVLEQIKKVLKEDGRLILTVPAFKMLWSRHDEVLSHYRRYNYKELKQVLEDEGFEIKRFGYYFATPFPIAFIVRTMGRIFKSKNQSSDTDKLPPGLINKCFIWIMKQEIKILNKIKLPFGTSLYAEVYAGQSQKNVTQYFQNRDKFVTTSAGKELVQS